MQQSLTVNEDFRHPVPEIPINWDTINNPQRGLRGYTYSHYSSDEVSSALQKGIRRGKVSESIKWALEMFLTGPANKTNAWNRLVVTAVEDIGPADPLVILKIWDLLNSKTCANTNRKDDPYYLATAVKILAESKKSRLNDWAAKIVSELRKPEISRSLGTPEQMKMGLIKALQEKNAGQAIYYEVALSFTDQKIANGKRGRNYPMWLIWEAFNAVIGNQPYMKALENISVDKSWRNNKKSRLLHLQIINLWCFSTLPEVSSVPTEMDMSIVEDVQQSYTRSNSIGIPDYALDKHTRKGKSLKRDMEHFVVYGSKLENVDKQWEQLSIWYYENGIGKTLNNTVKPIIGSYSN